MTTLHLVRPGAAPLAVADRDWVVYLQAMQLAQAGSPHTAPQPLGPLDHDRLIILIFAADRVITW